MGISNHEQIFAAALRSLALPLAIESAACLLYLLLIPGEGASGLALGNYSTQRWVLIISMTAVTLVMGRLVLAWRRHAEWLRRASLRLAQWLGRPLVLLCALGVASIGLLMDLAFVAFWVTTSDQSYLGIFSRLAPFLLLVGFVTSHSLVLLWRRAPQTIKQAWLRSIVATVLITGAQWFFLADALARIPLPVFAGIHFVLALGTFGLSALDALADRPINRGWLLPAVLFLIVLWLQWQLVPSHYWPLFDVLPSFLPVILVSLVIVAKMGERLNSALQEKGWPRYLLLLASAALLLSLVQAYHAAASEHARTVNTDFTGDQRSFMGFTKEVYDSGFTETGIRNQMPALPYIQALFFEPENDLEATFALGKQVNIGLSLALLAGLFFVFLRYLSHHQAINLLMVVAFGSYIFRAPYFTAEVLFYALFFFSFLLMLHMLKQPSLTLGIVTGAVLALSQLAKASMIPGIVLYIAMVAVQQIHAWAANRRGRGILGEGPSRRKTQLIGSILLVATFLAVFFPYGIESWRRYGDFFYNVSYSVLWFDSWEDVIAAGATGGLNTVSAENLPTLADYLGSHSLADIVERIQYGIQRQWENFRYQFNLFHFPIFLLSYALIMLALRFRRGLDLARRQLPVIVFVLLFHVGYVLLFIWYAPLAGLSRFLYSLFLPLVFSAYVTINALCDEHTAHVRQLMDWGLTALLVLDIPYVLETGLFLGTFGS